MNLSKLIAILLIAGCSGGTIVEFDAMADPDSGLDAGLDAETMPDAADDVIDGGTDTALPDTGDADVPPDTDAGTDAPPADPCPGAVWDSVANRCYVRVRWVMGDLCRAPLETLRWDTVEDQRRIEALVIPMGPAGTGLGFSTARGAWWFFESGDSVDSIDWAPTWPRGSEPYTYFSSDGLRSYHRAYSFQLCMFEAS